MKEEKTRFETFKDYSFSIDSHALAKAGFYYTKRVHILECSMCHFQIDAANLNQDEDRIIALHKKEKPECTFVQNQRRSKKFVNYDSLRFEKERLDTFIEWPHKWLKPSDLARDGFYYLRTADHCACVFCRGIIGAWEIGDTPRGEHQRHFPHCPFIRNQPSGNIPLIYNELLAQLEYNENTSHTRGTDVCGLGRSSPTGFDAGTDVCGLGRSSSTGFDAERSK